MNNFVSLLPLEYRKNLQKGVRLRRIRWVMLFLTILTVVAAACATMMRFSAHQAVLALREENQQMQQQVLMLAPYETTAKESGALKLLIASVQALDPGWSSSIHNVAGALPAGVWLESLSTNAADDGGRILSFECGCTTYDDIGRTLAALASVADVFDVRCDSSSQSNAGVRFHLAIALTEPKQ
ncbi:MAG: hypothetical protein RR135_02345 [Oscillospiraceae bacterium]